MGMPISDLLNHVLKHIYDYLAGSRAEDDLAHAAWGLMTAMHSQEKWPHLNTDLRGPNCELTPEQRAKIAEANAQRTAKKAAAAESAAGVPRADDGAQEPAVDRPPSSGRLPGVGFQFGPASPNWPKQV